MVSTANDVTKLPPELLRRGRFDELFFVDLPGEAERKDIINLYINRNLLNQPSSTVLDKLVEMSDGFAGADLEGAARDVAIQAVIHGDSVVDDTLFEKCFRNIVPLSKTAPEKIEAIRTWGGKGPCRHRVFRGMLRRGIRLWGRGRLLFRWASSLTILFFLSPLSNF